MAQRQPPYPSKGLTWLSGCTSSSPTSCPSGAAKLRKVDATKTPPGRSTREISASAACGLGQQWMAAPACTAATAGRPGAGGTGQRVIDASQLLPHTFHTSH